MSEEEKNKELIPKPENKGTQENIPDELQEMFKDAPPAVKKMIQATMFSAGPMPPSVHPIFNKFTESHVDKFLDYSHADDNHTYELEKSSKFYNLLYISLVIGFLVFLVVFLAKDNQAILTDILKILVVFGGGFGSGFGFKSHLDKKKR